MKTIQELEEILDKRNEYIVALYEDKTKQGEQLSQLKEEYKDLEKKMILSPSTKNKTKLEEMRKKLKECEEQFENTENDIKHFEDGVFDIAPYRPAIINEYSQEVKADLSDHIERLKQAKQNYESIAAELTECVKKNIQLRSKTMNVLNKAKQDREEIEMTERGFGLNQRNQKINQYIQNEIDRIQSQLSPFILGTTSANELEVKSIFDVEFLGNLI